MGLLGCWASAPGRTPLPFAIKPSTAATPTPSVVDTSFETCRFTAVSAMATAELNAAAMQRQQPSEVTSVRWFYNTGAGAN